MLSKTIKIEIIRTVIFFIVLYGYENWSVKLKEEHMLSMFQSKVLRRKFGHKRDKLTGQWREIHNEELNDLYSSPNSIWVIKSRKICWVCF
jgi:hypothetical protein